MEHQRASEIAEGYRDEPGATIATLQDIQREENYVPPEALAEAAMSLNVPLSQLYSVATFYSAFSLKPRGRHVINVCLGTACHVRGGTRLLEKLERDLGVSPGQMTRDRKYSLETVRCVGCCSLSPVVTVDGDTFGRVRQDKLPAILKRYDEVRP